MSPSLYASVAEKASFRFEAVALLCSNRLLAVSRCGATLVVKMQVGEFMVHGENLDL